MTFLDIIKGAGNFIANLEKAGRPDNAPLGQSNSEINIGKPIEAAAGFIEKSAGAVFKGAENIAEGLPGQIKAALKDLGGEAAPITTKDISQLLSAAGLEMVVGGEASLAPGLAFIIADFFSKLTEGLIAGAYRAIEYSGNAGNPNRIFNEGEILEALHRELITNAKAKQLLSWHGYDDLNQNNLIEISRKLLGLGEIIGAYHRGLYDDKAHAFEAARKLGIHDEDIERVFQISLPLISAGEAITMWRRGIKIEGDKDAFGDLRRAGWTDQRIEALKEASHTLPGILEVQDFKVRRVDDPAVVDKFKLDAFLDEDYFTQATKLGYTKEDAQRIYRYYWNYPQFFILKDLYAAGKMTEQDFRDVMGFQRFTPYWIDRFAELLKPMLTQGDIKDQYKYQIIGADEIVPALQKIGVTLDLAEQLKTLWIASVKLASPLDQTGSQATAGKIKTDTASLIKTAYKDKVISRDQALEHFKAINYTDDAAQLEMGVADYEIAQERIKTEFAIIKEDLLANIITLGDAVTKLQALGVTADQLDLYSSELQKATTHKPKVPTLAEFTSWYKKGIIDINQYAQALSLLGYDALWIPYYLQIAGATNEQIAAANISTSTALSQ